MRSFVSGIFILSVHWSIPVVGKRSCEWASILCPILTEQKPNLKQRRGDPRLFRRTLERATLESQVIYRIQGNWVIVVPSSTLLKFFLCFDLLLFSFNGYLSSCCSLMFWSFLLRCAFSLPFEASFEAWRRHWASGWPAERSEVILSRICGEWEQFSCKIGLLEQNTSDIVEKLRRLRKDLKTQRMSGSKNKNENITYLCWMPSKYSRD